MLVMLIVMCSIAVILIISVLEDAGETWRYALLEAHATTTSAFDKNECEINSVNAKYIFPLFINGKQCLGLRDSGCFSNLLVAKHLISAQDYIPHRFVKIQGLFDNGRLPVTQVSVQSPKFCSDEVVRTTAAVCDKLPCNIDCIVGNAFFCEFPMLRDVINLQCDSETELDVSQQNDSGETDRHLHSIVTNAQTDDDSTAQITNVKAINCDSRVSEYVTLSLIHI